MSRSGNRMLIFLAAICSIADAAESHRVVVLDAGVRRGAVNHRLMLVEVESGKVLVDVELGSPTNLAVSDDGSTVAVLTGVGAPGKRESRLNFYRATDLGLVQSGRLSDSVAHPARSK